MALRHSATYQGIPCKAVQFRRSDGLAPEPGFLMMDSKDAKQLRLEVRAVPWTPSGKSEMPGPLSIQAWNEFKSSGSGANNNVAAGDGFDLYGELVLKTEADEGSGDEITYKYVYIDAAEETTEDLADVKDHDKGEILIQLTDIRRLYPDHGIVLARINCRLPNGKYDPMTVKKPRARDDRGRNAGPKPTITKQEDEAWPFEDVMEFLFSQLPGSPKVHFDGLGKMPDPEEIDQVGAQAVNVIQEVLDNFGLVAKFQPDGSYLLAKPGAKHLSPGQVAPSIGGKSTPSWTSYETKTITWRHVAPVVMVLGRRRLRRMTQIYIPVFQDADGRIYRLEDIHLVWEGYSLEQVNRQVPIQPHKSFQDVPPKQVRGDIAGAQSAILAAAGDPLGAVLAAQGKTFGSDQSREAEKVADIHFRRQEIMRSQAYRLYAPIQLFNEKTGPRNGKGALFLGDRDQWPVPWLPIQNAPMFEPELLDLYPGHSKARTGVGGALQVPPIVRGSRIGQTFYTDVFKATQQLRDRTRSLQKVQQEFFATAIEALQKKAQNIADAEFKTREAIRSGQDLDSTIAAAIWKLTSISFDAHGRYANLIKKRLEDELNGVEAELKWAREVSSRGLDPIKKAEQDFQKVLSLFHTEGGIHVIGNLPYGPIPQGTYNLDIYTGLLKFDEPVCQLYPPICLDPESTTVVFDGMVSVTFGYEVNRNEPTDFSSILFARDENGNVEACGTCRPSHVKPYVVHAPDMQILENDKGEPMNFEECIGQAQKKAEQLLKRVPEYEGYTTKYSGFVKAVLVQSVDSIQHIWDGDVAHTHVAINSPATAMPLGTGQAAPFLNVEWASNVARKRATPMGGQP